jgi:pilus assembly protein CpaB
MKRRNWLWFAASAVLAVVAGVVAVLALLRLIPEDGGEDRLAEQYVVVASNPIAAGSRIRADNIRVEPRPVSDVPSGAAVSTDDVLNKEALRDIPSGDVIRMQYLIGDIGELDLERELGDDKIAMVLPADDILSKWGAVLPGDHVDVLFTIDLILETPMKAEEIVLSPEEELLLSLERDQHLDSASLLTVQNLKVLRIIEEPQAQPAGEDQEALPPQLPRRALVLKVDPQDAAVLKYLRNTVGVLDLALRSPENDRLFDVDPVNINYLMLRYGIVVPEPLE